MVKGSFRCLPPPSVLCFQVPSSSDQSCPVESREGDQAGSYSALPNSLATPLLLMTSIAMSGEGYLQQADTGAETSASIDTINLHFYESFSCT